VRIAFARRPLDEQNGERLVQLQKPLHLVEKKLKNDRSPIDSRVGNTNGLVFVAEQAGAPDGFRPA
jgi:hypothetical protein